MKVLAIYVDKFSYTPNNKSLEDAEDVLEGDEIEDAILAMVQVEESDEEFDYKTRGKKLVNHLKWCLRKNQCKKVVLHSFAHLSESKASAPFSKEIFDNAQDRFENVGIECCQTPFGYFLNLNISAPGFSLARIWTTL